RHRRWSDPHPALAHTHPVDRPAGRLLDRREDRVGDQERTAEEPEAERKVEAGIVDPHKGSCEANSPLAGGIARRVLSRFAQGGSALMTTSPNPVTVVT